MSKKSKKNEGIGSKLALVIKSGKYHLGTQQCLKDLRKGEGKLLIVANNCPPLKKSEIQYYAMLSRCKFHQFNGNNIDLGRSCGKYFRTSVVTVLDQGDSDILETLTKQN
ncbi:ribosomal protein L30 [Anaeramoeba flamelloides]|uniref:Ribosomal protein L30 n=1 Tax=Anaeramoeba flamelloides TaxID=1746091 RepID=A0ABQ8YLY4_9EUKA|nr:ribosomal protein L30 [Anaeramoeba flamelloides]